MSVDRRSLFERECKLKRIQHRHIAAELTQHSAIQQPSLSLSSSLCLSVCFLSLSSLSSYHPPPLFVSFFFSQFPIIDSFVSIISTISLLLSFFHIPFPILPVSFLSFTPFIHFPFLLHSTWLPIPLSHISNYYSQANQSNIISFRCDIQDLPASRPVLSIFCHYFSSLPLVSFILLSNSVTMRWVESSTYPVCVLFEQTQLCALWKELLSQKLNCNRFNSGVNATMTQLWNHL